MGVPLVVKIYEIPILTIGYGRSPAPPINPSNNATFYILLHN